MNYKFHLYSSTIYANDVLKESLVKEITFGTYSFKLNEDVNKYS